MSAAFAGPLIANGESLMPALFLALMIVIWIARQFGDKPPQQRQPRLPGGPRNQGGGGPPAGQRQPQAAGQLQREIEDFLNQVNRGAGQKKPAPEAAEPVFDAPPVERPRRAPERRAPEAEVLTQREEREALRGRPDRQSPVAPPVQPAARGSAAPLEQPRRETQQSGAAQASGKKQRRRRRLASRTLGSSPLGNSLREHLKDYMGEDHLPQQLRDRLVDEVEAHLGRMAEGSAPGGSRAGQLKQNLITALKDPNQVKQAILVHELLTPYSRTRSRRR